MGFFSKTKKCQRTGKELPADQLHHLDMLPAEYGNKDLYLCPDVLMEELDRILSVFQNRAVVFPPLPGAKEYYFYGFADIEDSQFDFPAQGYASLRDILPPEGARSALGNEARFTWCDPRANGLDYRRGQMPLNFGESEFVCRQMLLQRLSEYIQQQQIFLKEIYPPLSGDDGIWLSVP